MIKQLRTAFSATVLLTLLCADAVRAQEPSADAFDPGANGAVNAIAIQFDGKIVVGGSFSGLGGVTGTTLRNRIGRVNADGALDGSFDPGANGVVDALAVQSDGKILVAGQFTMLGGGGTGSNARSRIGRLNGDGSIDATFDPGANGNIAALAVQADGKILVGGAFTTLGGGATTPRSRVGRLNADGSIDATFDPGPNGTVTGIAIQPDGKILIAGDFASVGGSARQTIARLNADGTLDSEVTGVPSRCLQFRPCTGASKVAVMGNGKIVLGGVFKMQSAELPGADTQQNLALLAPNGALLEDYALGADGQWHWSAGETTGPVYALATQPDGKVLVGGSFTGFRGAKRRKLGRLNLDGTFDAAFRADAGMTVPNYFDAAYVGALALQPDGRIVVGGDFARLGSAARRRIGRLGPTSRQILVGLGQSPVTNGWIAAHDSTGTEFPPAGWLQLPWPAYNATNGSLRVAAGDVDGDGLDELVVGLGPGGGGWMAVFDDAAHNRTLLTWIQVSWSGYATANGEVWPAVGDFDGDGKAEIVAGLGAGGQGWFEIFDDATTGYNRLAWRRVHWDAYNTTGSGATHPAIGDLDGNGVSEIILGLGTGSDGWMEVISGTPDAFNSPPMFSSLSWVHVNWSSYNAGNGTTFPAVGDLDGDGRAEVVAGLGTGGHGWIEIFTPIGTTPVHASWLQSTWPEYNNGASGEMHPAVGNIDDDAMAEIVIGVEHYPGDDGWLLVFDDARTGYFEHGWFNLDWPTFRNNGGGTYPAIARR